MPHSISGMNEHLNAVLQQYRQLLQEHLTADTAATLTLAAAVRELLCAIACGQTISEPPAPTETVHQIKPVNVDVNVRAEAEAAQYIRDRYLAFGSW